MRANFDTRDFQSFALSDPTGSVNSLVKSASPTPAVSRSGLTGAPTVVTTPSPPTAFAVPADPAALISEALDLVTKMGTTLGFAAGSAAEFTPDPHVATTTGGTRVVQLHQSHRGIPVFEMQRTVRFIDGQGTVVRGDNTVIPASTDLIPSVTAVGAMSVAAAHLAVPDATEETDGWGQPLPRSPIDLTDYEPSVQVAFQLASLPTVIAKGPFAAVTPMHLIFFPLGSAGTRLAWQLTISLPDAEQFIVVVGADKDSAAEVLYVASTTMSAAASGNVWEHNPGESNGQRRQVDFPRPADEYPPLEFRTIPNGFPRDWVAADRAVGNATKAVLGDTDQTLRGATVEGRVLFGPKDDNGDDQKILNIFYFCSYMHDFFEMLGFDEASGNFQWTNYAGHPSGRDSVIARAHPGAVYGTANMRTPIDGSAPEMNMGLVVRTNRHTAFDSDVVFHEFAHGVTNRLVGGRLNIYALNQPQSRGLGEGWGDYFALTIQNYWRTVEKVVTGDWILNDARGLRKHPYDANYSEYGTFADLGNSYTKVHDIGEIWCATLMHMNRLFGAELGDLRRGHRIAWQIVVDAMKTSNSNPSFIDMRDAILDSLSALKSRLSVQEYQGLNVATWAAFAKFGMGPTAGSAGASLFGIHADFNTPHPS